MLHALDLQAGLAEMIDFSTRAANAFGRLAQIREENIQVAQTPREKVDSIAGRTLYRIALDTPRRVEVPVLVSYAMVGHWSILDLQDDRSFLRKLSEAGCDVYVIDWGHPTLANQFDDFSDLVDVYIGGFVEAIRQRHGVSSVNMLGMCQGGVLSLCYAALHRENVRNLITVATPVDFHIDQDQERTDTGFVNVWTRGLAAKDIDLLVDAMGNIPGEMGGTVFSLMTPFRTLTKYNMTLVQAAQDPDALMNFLRMEKWLANRPDHPGTAARQWLKELYQNNKLVRGELVVDQRPVDLKVLDMPILNVYSDADTIVHPLSCKAMRGAVGSKDYTEMSAAGGHVGILVSRSKQLPQTIADWLQKR
jgi:polyhydroxyalkanoate synthase subunit PhaC